MAFWRRKGKSDLTINHQSDRRSSGNEVEREPVQEGTKRILSRDWMDDVIQEDLKKEEIGHLLGKPINLNEPQDLEYQFNKTLKNANFLPPWIELQHEIRDQIGKLLAKMESLSDGEIEEEIKEINLKIRKYNQSCPATTLQKSPIFRDSIAQQYQKWV